MPCGQFHADLRPGGAVAQVQVDQRDVAIVRACQRALAIGGDCPDRESGILDDLLDFQCDENLVFDDQYLLAHSTTR